jgi:four helix bundle protein
MGFNFEKLDVYEKSIDFVNQVYLATRKYPKEEMFGLTNQFRRTAVSISLNIAEGSAKTKKDFNRFVDTARGSVFECVAILQISQKLSYISQLQGGELRDRLVEISKMLSGLKRSLAATTPRQAQ